MAIIIKEQEDEITIQVSVKLTGSMLEMENQIQSAVNEVGKISTEAALKRFDTNGSGLQIGNVKMSSKGKQKKEYETPYGCVSLERYVYQTSKGGKTYCPLDDRARIIVCSTPKFAKMISNKYASLSAREVSEDLDENHGRHVARGYVQNVADMVGSIAAATEESFDYEIPELPDPVTTISTSLDGTCVLMKQDGYREAMTGNISLYNHEGERLHTVYLGAAPEQGKATFLNRFQQEIDKIKLKYPQAEYVGIADGAAFNWRFLEPNTSHYILDFYHATEYLSGASLAFGKDERARKKWLSDACHTLKHEENAAQDILKEMEKQREILEKKSKKPSITKEKLEKAITYFTNQKERMSYKAFRDKNFPIGSGVTEAACKTLIKERLCRSAMQWKSKGATIVIALRALVKTKGRWNQFWGKIESRGLSEFSIA